MTLADVARANYAVQASLADRVRHAVGALWAELDIADLAGSWAALRLGERLFVTLAVAQLAAASTATRYVSAALRQQGATSTPAGELSSRSLAGVSSDGRKPGDPGVRTSDPGEVSDPPRHDAGARDGPRRVASSDDRCDADR